jgi:hypothetical protein
MPAPVCTHSSASGAYTLEARTARRVVLSATGEGYDVGYAREGLPIDLQREQSGLDIVLRPGGAKVSGIVVDALGGPIARARVLIEGADNWVRWVRETRTDDDGRFSLQTALGFQTVRAESEGYAPRSRGVVAPIRDVTIQLTPQSVVRGRVVQSGTGAPVTGVEVSARPDGFLPRSPSARSDEAGQFFLFGLEPGHYLLTAQAESWRSSAAHWADVHLVDVVEDVVLEVSPAVRVSGQVQQRGRDGLRPCAQGMVTLDPTHAAGGPWNAPQPGGGVGIFARIESDGHVRFSGAAPGRYDVGVRCPGHVLAQGPRQLELSDKALDVTWTVEPGLTLTVQVVDALSRPVPNTPIMLLSEPEDRQGLGTTTAYTTDERGRVVVRNELVPGKYSALVQSESGEGAPPSVQLRRGSPPATLTLKLAGSSSIDVVARDEAGKPISGLHVTAYLEATPPSPASAAPDTPSPLPALNGVNAHEVGDGHYLVGPLKPASYEVRIEDGVNPSLPGAETRRVRLRPGDVYTLQVSLPRNGLVRGKVVDEHGEPAENAWVSATAEGEEQTPAARARFSFDPPNRVLTNADGTFELTGLRPGARYTLRVKQPFENAAVLHGVTEGQTVRFTLPPSGSVAGTLLDRSGGPLPFALVSAQSTDTGITREAQSGPDGSFLLERIPAGHVQVVAMVPGLGFARLELDHAPGQRMTGQALSVAAPAAQLPSERQDAPAGAGTSASSVSLSPAPGG